MLASIDSGAGLPANGLIFTLVSERGVFLDANSILRRSAALDALLSVAALDPDSVRPHCIRAPRARTDSGSWVGAWSPRDRASHRIHSARDHRHRPRP